MNAYIQWTTKANFLYVIPCFRYKKAQGEGQAKWQTLRVVPDEATSLTIYNLFPITLYQFSVLSRNRLGDGLFSKIVTAKTKGMYYKFGANHEKLYLI